MILNREKLPKIARTHRHEEQSDTLAASWIGEVSVSRNTFRPEYFFFFQTAAISRVITVIPARAVIEREQKRRLIALGRNHPGGEAPLFFESHL